ncbi:kynureninase [Chlamydia felis Fe/C-56]|uniref:Kynureninase n=1 Tax=Chlamydia felis (strain Fe/C-56) TaxID=264202 RepID=Q254T2_CHLFF|nr:kynureninase [Chlamydia felis]BAE81206.1 kynureninase [Chlamydia felis Fe/C-56]
MNEILKNYQKKATQLDEQDCLKHLRARFSLPKDPNAIYFCNNSLGLPAVSAFTKIEELLQCWSDVGVNGWFEGTGNWYRSFDRPLRQPLSKILGAEYEEVIVMNSLTMNLHLLLVSFYRPTDTRYKILIEGPTFPSDLYAIKSHLSFHGRNPDEALIILKPRADEDLLRYEDFQQILKEQGESIALVFMNCVNFLTGQVLEVEAITHLAKEKGCIVGCDLAHAAGNIPLKLHEWGVDFALGCSYKYLCGGPGGPGIAYVHKSHHDEQLPRFSGWWGNDPETRFQMQLQPEFVPYGGAYSWQVSTPSILSLMPLLATLEVFEEAGMERVRNKSKQMTAFLLELLELAPSSYFEIITPRDPELRGSQLSVRIQQHSEEVLQKLEAQRITCDSRPPDIIRVTPTPLYNTFSEIYQFTCKLLEVLEIKL